MTSTWSSTKGWCRYQRMCYECTNPYQLTAKLHFGMCTWVRELVQIWERKRNWEDSPWEQQDVGALYGGTFEAAHVHYREPMGRAQFLEHAVDVIPDGLFGNAELKRDLLVRQSARNQADQLLFAIC